MLNRLTNTRTFLPYQGSIAQAMTGLCLAFLALFYLLILFFGTPATWLFYAKIYLILGGMSLTIAGLYWSKKLQQAATWFQSASTPHRLWRAWLLGLIRKAWLYLIVFAFSMNLLEFSHQSISNWSAVWGIAALCVSSGLLVGLMLFGMLPRRLGIALALGMIVSIDEASFASWREKLLSAWLWHAGFLLTWTLISGGLLIRWKNPPSPQNQVSGLPQMFDSRWFRSVKHQLLFFRRYSALEVKPSSLLARNNNSLAFRSAIQMMIFVWLFLLANFRFAGWQEAILFKHLLYLALFSAAMGSQLMVKDLHWRLLLRPRGLQQGRIASHILLSTLGYYFRLFVVIAAFFLATYFVLSKDYPQLSPQMFSTIVLWSPFVILGLSITIAVRGCRYPRRVAFYLFNFILLFIAAFSLYAYVQGKNPLNAPITTMSAPTLITAILFAALAIELANQLWTQERLLPYLKRD